MIGTILIVLVLAVIIAVVVKNVRIVPSRRLMLSNGSACTAPPGRRDCT